MEKNKYIEAVRMYGNTVFRIAYQYCGNKSDAEDITQNTFLKLLQSKKCFDNGEYLKRWLIRVAINDAKNLKLSFWRRNVFPMVEVGEKESYTVATSEYTELHDAVMKLPAKYRVVVHLFYFEDYSIKEIAEIVNVRETTVQTQLMRARTKLREQLKEVWEDE